MKGNNIAILKNNTIIFITILINNHKSEHLKKNQILLNNIK